METTDINLEGIIEVKEVDNEKEANGLLKTREWKLLQLTTEKLRRTYLEISYKSSSPFHDTRKLIPVYNEELCTNYVLGRYKK